MAEIPGGRSDDTWTNGGTSLPELLSSDPDFAANTDVFVFEYYTPKFRDAAMIPELADEFNGMLETHHVWDKHQKVIFVAHSMGGLVVRQSLIAHHDHLSQIPLMYFYATPTNGSEITQIAKELSSNEQLRDMLPIEGNAFLSSVSSNWTGSTELRQIPTSCAYEVLRTGPIFIVPRGSATALCNRSIDPITADHIGIVKPTDRDDQKYALLALALRPILAASLPMPPAAPAVPRPVLTRPVVPVPAAQNQPNAQPGTPQQTAESETIARYLQDLCPKAVLWEKSGWEMRDRIYTSVEDVARGTAGTIGSLPVTSRAVGSLQEIQVASRHLLQDANAFPDVQHIKSAPVTPAFSETVCTYRDSVDRARTQLEGAYNLQSSCPVRFACNEQDRLHVQPPQPPPPQRVEASNITPELIVASLRKHVTNERGHGGRVKWYVWLNLPANLATQVRTATYRFPSDYLPGEVSADDVNPSRGLGSFFAWACEQDGTATVYLKNGTKVATAFDLCILPDDSSVPR